MSRLVFCWRVAVGAASKLTLPHFCRSVNEIGDDGAKALAVALQSNSSLTRLDLSGNQHAASVSFRCDEECFTFVGCSNSTWRRRPCVALADGLKRNQSVARIALISAARRGASVFVCCN